MIQPESGFEIKNPRMLDIYGEIYDYAYHDLPCLFLGATGTGKEYAARYYYQVWKQHHRKGAFHAINCSVLGEGTAQSELFGHIKGAFTNAFQSKAGLFEKCNPGVLFLDEIADLPISVQPMLLRAVDPGTLTAKRLGGQKAYSTGGVQMLSATDQPLEKLRTALLNRLGMQITIPALDERPEDRDEAVKFFTAQAFLKRRDRFDLFQALFNEKIDSDPEKDNLPQQKEQLDQNLLQHSGMAELIEAVAQQLIPLAAQRRWPGNFRSLRIIIDTAVIRSKFSSGKAQLIRQATYFFNYHANTYSKLDSYLIADSRKTATESRDMSGDPLYTEIDKSMGTVQKEEKIQWTRFLQSHPEKTFSRRDIERELNLHISTRSIQNRLADLVKAGLLIQRGGRKDQYRVSDLKAFMPPHLLKKSAFLPLPDSGDNVDPAIVDDLEKTFEQSRHIYISGAAASGKSALALALGERQNDKRSVYYCDPGENGLLSFFRLLVEKIKQQDLGRGVPGMSPDSENLNHTAIMITGYIDTLFKEDGEPLFILDSVQYIQNKNDYMALKTMLTLWPRTRFLLVGDKMPVSLESEMTEFILGHNPGKPKQSSTGSP